MAIKTVKRTTFSLTADDVKLIAKAKRKLTLTHGRVTDVGAVRAALLKLVAEDQVQEAK